MKTTNSIQTSPFTHKKSFFLTKQEEIKFVIDIINYNLLLILNNVIVDTTTEVKPTQLFYFNRINISFLIIPSCFPVHKSSNPLEQNKVYLCCFFCSKSPLQSQLDLRCLFNLQHELLCRPNLHYKSKTQLLHLRQLQDTSFSLGEILQK